MSGAGTFPLAYSSDRLTQSGVNLVSRSRNVPLVLLMWVAFACGSGAAGNRADSARGAGVNGTVGVPIPDCRLTPRAPASQFLPWNDVNQLMVWRDQTPIGTGWRWEESKLLMSEPRLFTAVRAFAFGFRNVAPLDAAMDGCYQKVLSTDGRLCPTVIAPGRELSLAQVETLYKLTENPPPRILLRCGFQPHHAFVFYGADGLPVADLRVCLTCGHWAWSDSREVQVSNETYNTLAELCRELGLEGCPAKNDEKEPWDEAAYQTWEKSGAPERPSLALGIARDRRLVDLTETDKRKLCAWRIVETRRERALEIEFADGNRLRFQSFDECVERFPRCEATLGEVENANFYVRSSLSFAAPTACLQRWAFGANGRCLWGVMAIAK
jgi:hypothetical protein